MWAAILILPHSAHHTLLATLAHPTRGGMEELRLTVAGWWVVRAAVCIMHVQRERRNSRTCKSKNNG
jgi:hypothetical protein